MAQYIDVKKGGRISGLRVVLTPNIPGPWSEQAKGILHVKNLEYTKVRQDPLGDNLDLLRWTSQTSAPVAVWNDDKPRSNWLEQLYLFERLAPEPSLIPSDFDERVLMIGLSNEILGEDGFIWNRRHLMVRDYTQPNVDDETREKFSRLGDKYWYSMEAARAAPLRCAEVLHKLTAQLERQQAHDSPYLVGDSLTALDIYWACTAALIEPLPETKCPMAPFFREAYTNNDPVVQEAAAPILLEHRDFIYERYLELPIDL